jgi:hypothetical protein
MFVRSFVSKKILWNLSVKSIIKCFVLNVPPSNNLECFIVKKNLGVLGGTHVRCGRKERMLDGKE